MKTNKNIDAILLTAGQSSRMGTDKALLEIHEEKIINIILNKLTQLEEIKNIYVILGHHHKLIQSQIHSDFLEKITPVYNENHLKGMYESIKKGASSITEGHHVLLHMIDQPFIELELYQTLIQNYDETSPIMQPTYEEKKGHPILIHKDLIPQIKEDQSSSLREFFQPYYKDRQLMPYNKSSILQNLNDYEKFKKTVTSYQ